MVASTSQTRLRHCLSDLDFPANKGELLRAADRNGADQETVRALRTLPSQTYTNIDQVSASVTIVDDGDAVRDEGKAVPE